MTEQQLIQDLGWQSLQQRQGGTKLAMVLHYAWPTWTSLPPYILPPCNIHAAPGGIPFGTYHNTADGCLPVLLHSLGNQTGTSYKSPLPRQRPLRTYLHTQSCFNTFNQHCCLRLTCNNLVYSSSMTMLH